MTSKHAGAKLMWAVRDYLTGELSNLALTRGDALKYSPLDRIVRVRVSEVRKKRKASK